MPRPPRQLPIIEFKRGARTNPAFQRGSQLAPLDLLNIELEGQGRPLQRLGYIVENVETSGLQNGTQLIKVHDLGNSQREAVSRFYRISADDSYIVNKGRLFVSRPEASNHWYDIEINKRHTWDFDALDSAPTVTRTAPTSLSSLYKNDNEDDGYRAGLRLVSNYFSFAYNFESRLFGIETVLSQAIVRNFPTYNGGTYDTDIVFTAYLPNGALPLPEWVDRVNFYMQTKADVPQYEDGATFDPNGTDKQYILFGYIEFSNALALANFDAGATPITLQYPRFTWAEGDTVQTPSDNESDLYPDGRGNFWRAEPTLTGVGSIDFKEVDAINNNTVSPFGLHPIMIYGERIWGWDTEEQLLRFSELGKYDLFPKDFALDLSKSGASRVSAIHPAPSVSAFFVFKQDAIHVIRGRGLIDGLRTQTLANTDLDASGVILQHGTLSPRTIVSGENGIYFISRDKKLKYLTINSYYGTTNVEDIGIAIDDFLAELTLEEQKNLVAFLFNNCYHVIMPDYVLVLDLQKRYWVRNSWQLLDAFWSEGGINAESNLYAITSDSEIVKLYEGFTDSGSAIPCEFESQDFQLPFETNVTGVVIQHTSEPTEMSVELYMDDIFVGQFTDIPQKGNHFRIACFGYGHRARVRIKSKHGIPLINAVFLEIP